MSGTLPTGGYPNWIDPSTGEHCYAKTGSKRLGQSPPPMCLCGHAFHTGPCEFIGACDGSGTFAFVTAPTANWTETGNAQPRSGRV